jgi:cell division protein ZipA
MEIGLREMLILMAVVVITVISVDIIKRLRQNRNALKFKLEPIPEVLDDPLTVEIGEVRKTYRDPAQHARFDTIEQAYEDIERPQLQQHKNNTHHQNAHHQPEQISLSADEHQPEPLFARREAFARREDPARREAFTREEFSPAETEASRPHSSSVSRVRVASEATIAATQQRSANKNNGRTRSYGSEHKAQAVPAPVDPSDVIILNIMARPQHHFSGDAIVKSALMCGLRYGENQIFHFYEPCVTSTASNTSIPSTKNSSKKEKAIFSLVNVVKPGTFDLNKLQDFTSPGLCLFMSVPGPDNIEASFQKMLMVAHKLANQLDTDLYDELHNPLTQKRLKQMHERIVQLHQAQLHQAQLHQAQLHQAQLHQAQLQQIQLQQEQQQNTSSSLHEVHSDQPTRAKSASV